MKLMPSGLTVYWWLDFNYEYFQTEAAEMKEKLEAARKSKETVILTRTDVRGMTRPLEKPQDSKVLYMTL